MSKFELLKSAAGGADVEVHQLVDTPEQAASMEIAWRMVLGRLKEGVVAASIPGTMNMRPRRPKRRGSTR
jgi:hypothetical protein